MMTSGKQKRAKRFVRDPESVPEPKITSRDVALFQALLDYRVLTAPQVFALFFTKGPVTVQPSTLEPHYGCHRRLQQLFHHGFVDRRSQLMQLATGTKPIMYLLAARGAALLAHVSGSEVSELGWKPKDNEVGADFLEHHLATNDIRIGTTLAAQAIGLAVPAWLDERTLRQQHMVDTITITSERGSKQKAAVVPDSYFVLEADGRVSHFFVEADMGTVTGEASRWGKRDWARKVQLYLAYHNSGRYKERYESQGFRVLTVTTSEQRLANLKRITEEAGGRARFWFTTFAKATPAAILTEPIWSVAGRDNLHRLID